MKTIDYHHHTRANGLSKTGLALIVVAAASLLIPGDAQARGYRGVGAGARGVGVAPGVGVGRPGVGVLPRGYHWAVPAGYRTVAYRGYTCRYVGGVYYRAAMYQGQTVWIVVQ